MIYVKRLLMAALVALLTLGCTDMNDLNRRVLVVALSLDVADNDEMTITAYYLKLTGGSGNGQSGAQALEYLTPASETVVAKTLGVG